MSLREHRCMLWYVEARDAQEPARGLSHQPLVIIWLAVCVGICGDRFAACKSPLLWCGLALATWLMWWITYRFRWLHAHIPLLMAIASVMAGWHHVHWRRFPSDHIAMDAIACEKPKLVALRAEVTSCPEWNALPSPNLLATVPEGVKTTFQARVTQVRHRDQWIPASGKMAVRVNGHVLGVDVGDSVRLFGQLTTPAGDRNPGQHDDRIRGRTERIICSLNVPYPDAITRLKEATPGLATWIGRLRSRGLSQLDKFVGKKRGVLAGALLLGARDRLGPDRTEVFFRTGTIHLLAISGLHVGILAWAFFLVARTSSARSTSLATLAGLTVIYCLLTGMRPPVLRAAILVQVACIGLVWRRTVLAYNALAAAAIVVLILQPAALFRPGAQLSFLAVGTLIWLNLNRRVAEPDPLDRLIRRSRPWYRKAGAFLVERVSQLASAGGAIWLVTLPLVMYSFHLVSPISLLLNVVLAAPVAIALLSGFGVLLTGNSLKPVAAVFGMICDGSLWFVEWAAQCAYELPAAYFWVGGPSVHWCLVFYFGLALLAFVPLARPTRMWSLALFMLWLAIPVSGQVISRIGWNSTELRCTFLAVGHGTCVVMELPQDRVLLYDCGRMGIPKPGVRLVSEYLWHRGIAHIDAVVLSHADADHYNLLPGLMERFSVGQVITSHLMFQSPGPAVAHVRDAIISASIPIRFLQANDRLIVGSTIVRVLHPLAEGVDGSDNANSVVLEVEHGRKKILLPGDLEMQGLEDVVAEIPRDCDVLMAPHHGSIRSSPAEFMRWCTPEYVVISGGERARRELGEAHIFAQDGTRVFHTARSGAVTVQISAGKVSVVPYLPK